MALHAIRLPEFEGPLDLLLKLIERRELDITAVSLVEVTDQYLAILHAGDGIDPDALADFLVVAARLLLIKSQRLLPPPVVPPREDEEGSDPAEELAQRLREYRRYQQAAGWLRRREESGQRSFPRLVPPPPLALAPSPGQPLNLTLADLQRALQRAQRRTATPPVELLAGRTVTIEEQMAAIESALAEEPPEGTRVAFDRILAACDSRTAQVVSFLALLQLVKQGRVRIEQEGLFSPIMLSAVARGNPPPARRPAGTRRRGEGSPEQNWPGKGETA